MRFFGFGVLFGLLISFDSGRRGAPPTRFVIIWGVAEVCNWWLLMWMIAIHYQILRLEDMLLIVHMHQRHKFVLVHVVARLRMLYYRCLSSYDACECMCKPHEGGPWITRAREISASLYFHCRGPRTTVHLCALPLLKGSGTRLTKKVFRPPESLTCLTQHCDSINRIEQS